MKRELGEEVYFMSFGRLQEYLDSKVEGGFDDEIFM